MAKLDSAAWTDVAATGGTDAADRFKKLYIFAFCLITSLVLVTQVVIQPALVIHEGDARLINIAGRQRMLSQKLTKAALVIDEMLSKQNKDGSAPLFPSARFADRLSELRTVLALWVGSHAGLQHGDAELTLPGANTAEIDALFDRMEPHYEAMREAAQFVLTNIDKPRTDRVEVRRYVRTIIDHEGAFLTGMDEIVLQYETEARARIVHLKRTGLILASSTVLAFFLVALFILAPAVRVIRRQFSRLHESEERKTLALQGADMGMWEWRIPTGELFIDKRLLEMLGYSIGEIEPHISAWDRIVHPQDFAFARDTLSAHIEGRTSTYECEYRVISKAGEILWILDRGRVVEREENGKPTRMAGTRLDITERTNLEKRLRQTDKMEAIGRLAGGVAHDFNNVLTVILGNVELLLPQPHRDMPIRSSEKVATCLEQIKFSAERAAALTQQLLAFSQRQTTTPQVIDIHEVLGDAERMLRPLLREDIAFHISVAHEIHHIRADVAQIEQVIMNLVLNARDAMPEGGRLTVRCANVEVDKTHVAHHIGASPGTYVVLTVHDNGVGMDKETMRHIFEPFYTTKPTATATGLGLATVYGIVKQAGAHIAVESEVGQGSTFKVYFPAADEEPASPEVTSPDDEAHGDEVLLVCEDEKLVRMVVSQTLRTAGYTVLEAENGKHALDVAAAYDGNIDLLISDVIMPVMNGKELAEAMVRRRPGLPVVFISGYTDEVLDGYAFRGEATAFLQKPFSFTTLLQQVRGLLDDARTATSKAGNPDCG